MITLQNKAQHLRGVMLVVSTKQAWVKLIPRLNSKYAKLFLKEVLATSHYPIHTLQTDNGSEFKKYFEEAAREAKLTHLFF